MYFSEIQFTTYESDLNHLTGMCFASKTYYMKKEKSFFVAKNRHYLKDFVDLNEKCFASGLFISYSYRFFIMHTCKSSFSFSWPSISCQNTYFIEHITWRRAKYMYLLPTDIVRSECRNTYRLFKSVKIREIN